MQSFPEVGERRRSLLCFLAVVAIRGYQLLVSPLLRWRGVTCLHYPTCSQYGLLAFRKYGFRKAVRITMSRCRDCHPFSDRPYIDYP
jgi:putative membrane protein insertion efficiency factor